MVTPYFYHTFNSHILRFGVISLLATMLLACGGGSNGAESDSPSLTNQTFVEDGISVSEDNTSGASAGGSAGEGQITLRWIPPTQYEDGVDIHTGELESYDIYWSIANNDLTYLNTISDLSAQEYTLYNLENGEYRFSIVAKTIYGTQSRHSNVIRKVIN